MLCPVITEKTLEKCRNVLANFPIAEIRMDLCMLSLEDFALLFSTTNIPLIATFRPSENISEVLRLRYYKNAIENNAAYIDVEENIDNHKLQSLKKLCEKYACELILSYHNYKKPHSKIKLYSIIDKAFKNEADLVKICCMSNSEKDNIRLLSLYKKYDRIIAFAMGDKGKNTRIRSLALGAPFAYVSVSKKRITAPGQMDIKEFRKILEKEKKDDLD